MEEVLHLISVVGTIDQDVVKIMVQVTVKHFGLDAIYVQNLGTC